MQGHRNMWLCLMWLCLDIPLFTVIALASVIEDQSVM